MSNIIKNIASKVVNTVNDIIMDHDNNTKDLKIETEEKNAYVLSPYDTAIIYCRISTKEQTLESQELACREYCERRNYRVIDVINETGSAYSGKGQKKLNQLLQNENINNLNLIIYNIDRFSRNITLCEPLIDAVIEKNINLECVRNPVNLLSAWGRHNFKLAVLDSQYECDRISERVKQKNTLRKSKGILTKSSGCFGFKLSNDKKNIVYNTDEQAIINFIISIKDRNLSSDEATQKLYGLLTKLSRPLSDYVPIEFTGSNDQELKITNRVISDILNDYHILKRGLRWNGAKVNNVYKASLNISKLTI